MFRAFYLFYRLLHWLLTGRVVRVGNFSVLPASALSRLVVMSELWNHYAGAVFRSKLPYERIPTDRGVRLGGRSHMRLIDLVVHGISGIATLEKVAASAMEEPQSPPKSAQAPVVALASAPRRDASSVRIR